MLLNYQNYKYISLRYRYLSTYNVDKASKSLEQTYMRKSPIEHILLRPGMYVGQVEAEVMDTWVFNPNLKAMQKESITYSPALLKIFDEILVNAADNRHRKPKMTYINVTITELPDGIKISIENNGKGIPVEIHKIEKIPIPELIFGHLLTGSNFDDNEQLMTGGRHGYGAKLTNIFSKLFEVETYDSKKQKLYRQKWENNMTTRHESVITKENSTSGDYTRITFVPDLDKFDLGKNKGKFSNIMKIFTRRVFDIAACVSPIKVLLNSKELEISSFLDYVQLFCASKNVKNTNIEPTKILSCSLKNNWFISVTRSENNEFQSMSFVNSVWTSKGGSHVNIITNQIVKAIDEILLKKKISVTSNSIKNRFMIFIRCDIANPTFDSQTKDTLTKNINDFTDDCLLPKKFLNSIISELGIVEDIELSASIATKMKAMKATSSKKSAMHNVEIPKLEDAQNAGTSKALDCTLILTEGDSAKALAVSGFEVVGRKNFGVLPLRGKILNVRDAKLSKVSENQELIYLMKALGLSFNKTYEEGLEGQGLRYGHLMLMCDQDHDGSHIKGLVINFFHFYFPHLLKHTEFLQQFITPLVKVRISKTDIKSFYSFQEFEMWLNMKNRQKLQIKYYKGLGTNTAIEGREYFNALESHRKTFRSTEWTIDNNAIDLAFNKSRADDRRTWLNTVFDAKAYIDPKKKIISFDEFINKELIQFSYADNQRSLPSIIDGLKPSQRKVLFGCFKKKLDQEMKVVQLAGYISEQTAYHHGEASLHATIIHMAQDFVGSNNVPLLLPEGQFGTRAQGGQDYASPRYIFTRLSPIARYLYVASDDSLLVYQQEDGQFVEPVYYIPVLPVILINGSDGIGTGWSTNIPQFHLGDVIDYIRHKLKGKTTKSLKPWVRGFKGTIKSGKKSNGSTTNYISIGNVNIIDEKKRILEITELPVGIWTENYKQILCDLVEKGMIKRFHEEHTTTSVKFIVEATDMLPLEANKLIETLRLTSNINLTNMHAFDAYGKIKLYNSPEEIIEEFILVRMKTYEKRHNVLKRQLSIQEMTCRYKAKFVSDILSGELPLVKDDGKGKLIPMSIVELSNEIKNRGFPTMEEIQGQEIISLETNEDERNSNQDYSYLLGLPIQSLTMNRSIMLEKQRNDALSELSHLESLSVIDLWLQDLDKIYDKAKEMKLL